jgi:hypothetical protein
MKSLERQPQLAINAQGAGAPSHNILSIFASTLLLVVSSFLGCGLTINSARASSASDSAGTGGEGGSFRSGGPTGGQTIPLPGSFRALTGCTNPNTGIASGDWGVATSPVYTVVNNTAPVVGMPIYTSNAVFWTSRENAPGQSILLTGAFTDATKTARLAFIPPGTANWQTLVHRSRTIVSTTQQGTTGLSFIIPSYFSAGVYGFEIDDPSAVPVLGLANVPALNWAIGLPPTTDSATALQHQVYDCGVEQGGILRLFGKNFVASDQVVLRSSNGAQYLLKVSRIDSSSVVATVPRTLSPGTYNVWVGTSPWSATSSPAGLITVHSPSPISVRKVNCSHLVGDGVTDNTASLQTCLDVNAPIGSSELAYFNIPPGIFVLTGAITAHPYEVLIGSSPTTTKFVGRPKGSAPTAWFDVPQYFGLTDLALEAPANPYLLRSSGTTTGDPLTSGHLFFNNIDFESTSDTSNGAEVMFALAGPDIQVYNSYFLSNSNQVFDINFGDGGIVAGNHMVLNNWTGLGISDTQNVIFENNLTDSQNLPGQGSGGHSGG